MEQHQLKQTLKPGQTFKLKIESGQTQLSYFLLTSPLFKQYFTDKTVDLNSNNQSRWQAR